MAGLITVQPFKALYTLLAILYEAARLPLWVLLYSTRHGRPHVTWTMRQALRLKLVKVFLAHSSAVRARTPLSLEPGKEGDRFAVIAPQGDWAYKGPTQDSEIKPVKIGATWTPAPLQRSQVDDADVVLHFHGGGYVVGSGRDADMGFTARTLLKHSKVTHVFAPQYRLSSNPGGRFPAALQDAITAYMHLTEKLRIPSSRITVSGDSAGANLALALLRYIGEHGRSLGMAWPGCVWLWSPWVNLAAALNRASIKLSPQYKTDYLGATFGHWGSSTFCARHNPNDPYISPLGQTFPSQSPIFIQTGGAEVLYQDNVALAKEFETHGTPVKLVVKANAPHDIILVGPLVGFEREAVESAREAGDFLRQSRHG